MPPKKFQKLDSNTQQVACRDNKRAQPDAKFPSSCVSCLSRGNEKCRFRGFRILEPSAHGLQLGGFHCEDIKPLIYSHPGTFEHQPDLQRINDMRCLVARFLLPIMSTEVEALKSPDVIFKSPEYDSFFICDSCKSAALFITYFCIHCAREICIDCRQDPKEDAVQCKHDFRPRSTANLEFVSEQLDAVLELCNSGYSVQEPKVSRKLLNYERTARQLAQIPTLDYGEIQAFEYLWHFGIPMLVNPQGQMSSSWSPTSFDIRHGTTKASVITFINGNTQAEFRNMTVHEFLQKFCSNSNFEDTFKLKNFPPTVDFEKTCPAEFADFMQIIPFPSHTSPRAFLNLASHYALSICTRKTDKPDLGPKMYLATADRANIGSTCLHLDATSAVNTLVHVEGPAKTGASWTIFRREDVLGLRAYLRKKYPAIKGDTIHSHSIFLVDDDFVALSRDKIFPFRFEQTLGQCVLIPAGCAHQVSNRTACIKIAIDFIDPPSIEKSIVLSAELRSEEKRDVLQIKSVLWHAWLSISAQLASLLNQPDCNRSRKKRKNAKQHQSLAGRNDHAYRLKLRMMGNGTLTEESYASSFVFGCPLPECFGVERLYNRTGIWKHILDRHEINVPISDRDTLASIPQAEWLDRLRYIRSGGNTSGAS